MADVPSLKGKFDRKDQFITELEREAAKKQGLIDDAGLLTDEAIKPKPSEDDGLAVPLSMITPRANSILEKVEDIVEEIKNPEGLKAPDGVAPISDGLAPPDGTTPEIGELDMSPAEYLSKCSHSVECNRCGWDLRNAFVPPKYTDDDKEAFVRHLMSRNGRFFKEFPLLSGNIAVVFHSRLQSETDAIVKAAMQYFNGKDSFGVSDVAAYLQKLNMAASIHRFADIAQPTNSEQFKPFSELMVGGQAVAVDALLNRFAEWPSALNSAICAAWNEFEQLYAWFTSKAYDPDFWKAADAAAQS